MELSIISTSLLPEYCSLLENKNLAKNFGQLEDAALSTPNFSFYTSVASVFSSKIEGEHIELDSFIKHRRDGIAFQPDYTKKIDDLYDAYLFAQGHALNERNLKEAHRILSRHLVVSAWQGKYRQQNMYVATPDGKIECVAAPPQVVVEEMARLFNDIQYLISQDLSIEAVFFYASMMHLVFVKIHPWTDGNGRTGRLLEKWFLAEKLGPKAWYLQSEKMYYQQHQEYYQNIRRLGLEYDELDYEAALPFLLMLPSAL
jgi:Fic family protein